MADEAWIADCEALADYKELVWPQVLEFFIAWLENQPDAPISPRRLVRFFREDSETWPSIDVIKTPLVTVQGPIDAEIVDIPKPPA